jgi:rhamnose transport system ATP-binding protein
MSYLELRDVRKSFGAVRALNGATLSVAGGEILGLCGENGAGKSTIVKVIAGAVNPDSGEVVVDGKSHPWLTPGLSASLGIGVVFQEFELVPSLKVYQNVFLGREEHRVGFLRTNDMRRAARQLLADVGAPVEVDEEVADLRTGHQQLVEISKAVARGTSVLVLDEPTAALNRVEKDVLFGVLRKLRQRGLAIVFISHFIGELFEICDSITVLRDGAVVRSAPVGQLAEDDVVVAMLGHRVDQVSTIQTAKAGQPVLELQGATIGGYYLDVDLALRGGEVVGLAGAIGSGTYEVAETLFGIRQPHRGRLFVDGRETAALTPARATQLGIGYVPEDRKLKGLCLNLGAAVNMALPSLHEPGYSRAGVIQRGQMVRRFLAVGDRLHLRPMAPWAPAASYSGGGQQKLLLGRWLDRKCKAYVLVEPTRGVDVGAKTEIWSAIRDLARDGAGVLVVSSEAADIVALCDRCHVMVNGKLRAHLVGPEVTTEAIARHSVATSISPISHRVGESR